MSLSDMLVYSMLPSEADVIAEIEFGSHIAMRQDGVVVNEALFGMKELGFMTIRELMALFESSFGNEIDDPEDWIYEYLGEVYGRNNRGPVDKLREMIAAPDDRLYYVKMELMHELDHDAIIRIKNILYGKNVKKPKRAAKKRAKKTRSTRTYSKMVEAPTVAHCFSTNLWIDGVLVVAFDDAGWTKSPLVPESQTKRIFYEVANRLALIAFKENVANLTEDLVATAMHPRRLIRHLELGGDMEDF